MSATAPGGAAPATPVKMRGWVVAGIVFILALDLAFAWQRVAGAHRSEFGGHPDEAGHYVTGLFVRDAVVLAGEYAAGGFHGSPVEVGKAFADTYYAHYPKIGLGVWPPFFYLVQAAWTLPFSPSRGSMLLLLCTLAAAVALQLFRALRAEFGIWPAALGAALLISLPLFRESYGMVMAETLSALLMFSAMLAWGAFLDHERRDDALRFGLFAALAILTKGTGLALALAAPLALVFVRKFHLLRRPALWAAVLLVAGLAGPWTWATRNLGQGGWVEPGPAWSFTREALPYYVTKFGLALGLLPLLLFSAGVLVKVRADAPASGRWAAAGALIIGVLVFQALLPVGFEARHLIPALPAALMFVVAGFVTLTKPRLPMLAAGALGIVVLVSAGWPLEKKGYSGFAPLARAVLDDTAAGDVVLVSSDARGEGMFISEVAMREVRPGHVVQRASKTLASSAWSGRGYAPRFTDDDALLAYLTGGEIQWLVLDDAVPEDKRREHQEQLQRLVGQYPDRFWLVASSEITRAGERQFAPAKLYKILPRN